MTYSPFPPPGFFFFFLSVLFLFDLFAIVPLLCQFGSGSTLIVDLIDNLVFQSFHRISFLIMPISMFNVSVCQHADFQKEFHS